MDVARIVVFGLVLICVWPPLAGAFCTDPIAPSFQYFSGKPTPPIVPYCVDQYSNTHTCNDWEIQTYNADIDRFNQELEAYVAEIRRYARDIDSYYDAASAHVRCLIDEVSN